MDTSDVQYQFRTKTGTCTITPDQILLHREGAPGAAADAIHGDSMGRSLAIYVVAGLLFLGLAVFLFVNQDFFAIVSAFVGVYLLWSAFTSRHNSAASSIDRASITAVEAHAPRPPLTRGYFAVRYVENGEERQRLIMLPGSLSGGKEAYMQAVGQMRATGLLEG